ncbi:MAG: hydrogenase maturation protease [Pseudobdellovibrionaceae bacterium]
MRKKIALIGLGNNFRSDDALGILAARKVKSFFSEDEVKMIESQGEVNEILDCFKENDFVFLMDAVASESLNVGEIIRIDFKDNGGSLNIDSFGNRTSSHAFIFKQIVDLATALDMLPRKLIIYGVVGDNFSEGKNISQQAMNGMEKMISMLKSELSGLINS